MATKRMTWKKQPGDQYFLDLIADHVGLDHSAVLRLALRDFAYRHGYALPEASDVALSLRDTLTALHLAGVSGELVSRGKAILKKHGQRLRKAYVSEPYPVHVERELLQEEIRLRSGMALARRRQ